MKNILVIGMGRCGRHLATKMQELGNDVMIVDRSEETIEELAPLFTDSFIGDCTNEAVIRSLGVNNFDVCFVCIGENFQSSLEITALLKDMNAKYVVSKANRDIQARFLKSVGADEVIYPERGIEKKLAIRFNADNVYDYIELTDEYSIFEIDVLDRWVGKTVKDLNFRVKYNLVVLATKKGDDVKPIITGERRFEKGEHLLVLGKDEDVHKVTK